MFRTSLQRLEPFRRLLSSHSNLALASSPQLHRLQPWNSTSIHHNSNFFLRALSSSASPTIKPGMMSPTYSGPCVPREAAPTAPGPEPTMPPREWPVDGRGEEIRTAKARCLGIPISQRKLNLVARLVRGMTVPEAYRQLAACNKKSAPIIARTLKAAVVNARAYGFREERLVVHEAYVGKGVYIRRIRPWHGKGRYGIHHKKYAHLTVIVREYDDELWELTVLPQYVHVKRGKKNQDDTAHPIHQSDKVSWVSDLDKGLAAAYRNIKTLQKQVDTKLNTPTNL